MKGKFIPKSREKMSHTPVKKYPDPDRPEIKFPDPDRPEIKFPDPTRPENILKNVPQPRTGFGPVRGNSGFELPRRSLIAWDKNILKSGDFINVYLVHVCKCVCWIAQMFVYISIAAQLQYDERNQMRINYCSNQKYSFISEVGSSHSERSGSILFH